MGEEELLLESTGRRRFGAALALIAMVLVVGMVVAVAVSAKGATDNAKPTPTGTPEILVLTHFNGGGIEFDYSASWAHVRSDFNMHYVTDLAYFGTSSDLRAGRGLPTCRPAADGVGTSCGPSMGVGKGELLVTLTRSDGPPRLGPIDPNDTAAPLDANSSYTTVAGLPAIYRESRSGDELDLEWTLSVPRQVMPRLIIGARIVGPGIETMRSKVQALVSSIRYDPPVPVLEPADGPRIAGLAIAQLRKNDASFGCFPANPGTSARAIVTQLPGYATLSKALPVTCETAIEPVDLGLWKLTLTQKWEASSDRTAGSLATTVWVSSAGEPGMQTSGPADVPYLGRGAS